MKPDVERLIEHCRAVEVELRQDNGALTLFALFERQDLNDQWDLVVSAPWLKPRRENILSVTHAIAKHLDEGERVMIARVVPVPPESDFVRDLLHAMRTGEAGDRGYTVLDWPHVLAEKYGNSTLDAWMGRGYVLTPLDKARTGYSVGVAA